MSWGKMFKRANSYAQAKAQTTLDAHADPKVQLEQAISELQAHHRDLEAAASHVIAQDKLAKMRLAELSTQEARYTKSAMAAQQQGNLDAARTFATKIAGLRDQIQGLSAQIPQLEAAAADARQAVSESAFQLQQKVNERSTIRAQIDQTRMQQEMASSMKQLSDLTGEGNAPSFDEIRQKVAGQFAEAQAQTELSSASPEVQEMHVHHAELTSEADAILAELSAGTAQPSALGTSSEPGQLGAGAASTGSDGAGSADEEAAVADDSGATSKP
ncbi:PspA/IM30 family protein [Acidiferrimicrobium sp. IK]|uniref:PspA/IM30 family protein n=1 Tax=Acidiferrimicrobium sp. IK TaxID=2871700 RepID=UPI0021CB7BC7|nr:PspA/IM30 family protein [Acidiferrimicrobium sp. IK]MCU4183971.1 PspA/IM30 family protein [Acidiferrimicrobium sp. IK]